MNATAEFSFLSHPLGESTPGYGGKKAFFSKTVKSLCAGDSCNQLEWTLSNHVGTHIDAPFHFCQAGQKIHEMDPAFWIFSHPQLLDHPADNSQLIEPGTWCSEIAPTSDLLLLRTGTEKKRAHPDYWEHNPGVAPSLGQWLRKERPHLRALGLDFISLTSYDHRPMGRTAHQEFLSSEKPGQPIWIVEDMRLAQLQFSPKKVLLFPLIVEGADGAPVTAIAEL